LLNASGELAGPAGYHPLQAVRAMDFDGSHLLDEDLAVQ
jgi:hypothetical protein